MPELEIINKAFEVLKGTLSDIQLQEVDKHTYKTFAKFIVTWSSIDYFFPKDKRLNESLIKYFKDDYISYILFEWMLLKDGLMLTNLQCYKILKYLRENEENLCQN